MTFEFSPAPLPRELAAGYRAAGLSGDATFPALMRRNGRAVGSRVALIEGGVEVTWSELLDSATRFGGFLQSQGIGPGDVVVWQLPNWWETLVVAYGIWAAGAISSPVVPIYREFELAHVIANVEPAAVVASGADAHSDRVAMIASACERAGIVPPVRVAVRSAPVPGWTPFEDALRARPHLADGIDPDAPALVGWTSGTTAGSKGVVHSTRGVVALPTRAAWLNGMSWAERSYMPAPVAHATGLISAIAVPLFTGSSTVLSAGWDASRAIDEMIKYGVTTSSGAAVFMREIVDAVESGGFGRLDLAAGYPCGGSTIPPELAEACDDLGMLPARSWGMTECPGVTQTAPRMHGRELRTHTDGLIGPGCELRLVGDDGADLGPNQDGVAWVRGPQRMLGYIDPQHTAEAFDDDGWFCTGDVGRLRDDGAFTYTGRIKDIINRGGEKLSAREIEEALTRHPHVREVAVVPAPHERLGEQPAAFVLADGAVDVESLASFLHDLGLAPQKIPRVWRLIDELPRTASGKVKKNELQAALSADVGPNG